MKKLSKKELAEQIQRKIEYDKQAKVRKMLERINHIEGYDKRMKAILKAYDNGYYDLFNWCDDYKEFISKSLHSCETSLIEYVLKKSWDDKDAPFNYDDFNMQYIDYEALQYDLLNDEDVRKQFMDWKIREGTTEFDKDTLRDVDVDELKTFLDDENCLDDYEKTAEVYEWWIIGDPLLYRLEKAGEVIYENIWGRQCTGQSVNMDSCCIHAFIDPLKKDYSKVKNG